MATTRERLHELLDSMPDHQLGAAKDALEALIDDGIPIDDEPFTDEDLADIAQTRAELARGETIPGDVVRRELGW
jgi:hypothetical protein